MQKRCLRISDKHWKRRNSKENRSSLRRNKRASWTQSQKERGCLKLSARDTKKKLKKERVFSKKSAKSTNKKSSRDSRQWKRRERGCMKRSANKPLRWNNVAAIEVTHSENLTTQMVKCAAAIYVLEKLLAIKQKAKAGWDAKNVIMICAPTVCWKRFQQKLKETRPVTTVTNWRFM